jgi:DNA-binding beta-propeller fold protein YncE
MARYFCYLILLFGVAVLNGCAVDPVARREPVDLSSAGYLSVFLDYAEEDAPLRIKLSDLEFSTGLEWIPLLSELQPTTDSVAQQLIAAASLPTGRYERLRFQLAVMDPAGTLLRQEQVELPFGQPFEVKRGQSTCLFIYSRLSRQQLQQPLHQQLEVRQQQQPLSDELLYILCPEIQTLYVARVDSYRIVAAYGIGEDIADMVLDNRRRLLYLLDRRHRLVQRFNTVTQTLTDRIPLPLTDRPTYLGISDDGNTLYVSDPANRQLLQIDARTGILRQRRTSSYQPGKIYPFENQQQGYLAVLYPRDQQLQVLPAQTLTPLYSVNVGIEPHDLAYTEQALFVSDVFAQQLLRIHPLTGQTLQAISTIVTPGTLVADPVNRNLLVGLCQDQAVAFLPFGQQLIARRAAVDGCPADMTTAMRRRLLFVALEDSRQVRILDLASEKQLGTIPTASLPRVIVFQEP